VTTTGVAAAPSRRRASAGPRRRRRREAALGYLLVLPAVAAFAIFVFYPFFNNFRLALYQTPPVPGLPSRYVGCTRPATCSSPMPTGSLAASLRPSSS